MLEPTMADIRGLTEPTRSLAFENLEKLLRQGVPRKAAIELALRQAEEWEASRAPGAATPSESLRFARLRSAESPIGESASANK